MARTIQEIYEEIIQTKEDFAELDSLLPNPETWSSLYNFENFKTLAMTIVQGLSVSKIAIWRQIMYIFAFNIWTIEQLQDQFTAEVEDTILNNVYGQLRWYVKVSKEWQYGDDLVWNDVDGKYEYETIDEEKQIITQANAHTANGQIILKVAKGELGSLEKLDTSPGNDELTSFTDYMKGTNSSTVADGIAPAGANLQIVSDDADSMRLYIDIFYNPLVLTAEGEKITESGVYPVEDAVTNYIQGLPFDSYFYIRGLEDAIQAAEGVDNVVVKNADAYYGSVPIEDITQVEGQRYLANAGYLEMDTSGGDPGYGLKGHYDYPGNTKPTLNYISI